MYSRQREGEITHTFPRRAIIIMRIPKSWISPHMVAYRDHSRFYARNSAGKYILDVQELRTAFLTSEGISKKINSFRLDRINRILSGETPIGLKNEAKIILHIVPYGFSDSSFGIDVTRIGREEKLQPIHAAGNYNPKHNLDGFVNFSEYRFAYTLLFRNGTIEAVNMDLVSPENAPSGGKYLVLHPRKVEDELIESIQGYLDYQETIGVNTPLVIMLAFSGVKDYKFTARYTSTFGHPIDRDILILPEVVIENFTGDVETTMKPIFDAMWNAAGIAKSASYDEAGKRKPR